MAEQLPTPEDVKGIMGDLDGMAPEDYLEHRYHGEYIERIEELKQQLADNMDSMLELHGALTELGVPSGTLPERVKALLADAGAVTAALVRANKRVAHYCAKCSKRTDTGDGCIGCALIAGQEDADALGAAVERGWVDKGE